MGNKTVEIVNEWAAFEERYPDAGLDEFCRYYLIKAREKENPEELFQGVMPPLPRMVLIKLLGRIVGLYQVYADPALAEIGIRHLGDFLFLNVIYHVKEPRKTEVIYETMTELSTGLLILSYLKQKKLITEHADPTDKRSKRVKITREGTKVLFKSYEQLGKTGDLMFGDMPDEDISLCIQLLKHVDLKFSKLWQQHKGLPLAEVIKKMK